MTQDFDEARRQAVARGWATSPLDQKTYAAQNGISARTLREWVRRYGVVDRPAVRAVVIIDTAIAQLQALRAALVSEAACQAGGEDDHGPDAQEDERHATSATVQPVQPLTLPQRWLQGGGFLGPF